MIKKAMIMMVMACAIISCKDDLNDTTPLNVKGDITTQRLVQDFTCNNNTYVFQIPAYEGDKDVENRLSKNIKNLITQDFTDVTYNKDASIKEIWNIFMNERERKICEGDTSGITNIEIGHLSQNDSIISYELVYQRNGKNKRLTKTFKKPSITELQITDLAKQGKLDDVRRIFDINLQQSVANLSLEIKTEEYESFRNFVESKRFFFSKEEFENASLGVKNVGKDSLILQVSKKIKLPAVYSYLNEDIKVEIKAKEMDYYLNLAPLKI